MALPGANANVAQGNVGQGLGMAQHDEDVLNADGALAVPDEALFETVYHYTAKTVHEADQLSPFAQVFMNHHRVLALARKKSRTFMSMSVTDFRSLAEQNASRACRDIVPRLDDKSKGIYLHTLNTLMITVMSVDPTAPRRVSFHQGLAASLIEALPTVMARGGDGTAFSLVAFPVHVLTAIHDPTSFEVAQHTSEFVLPPLGHFPAHLDIVPLNYLVESPNPVRNNAQPDHMSMEGTIKEQFNRIGTLKEENGKLKERLKHTEERNRALEAELKAFRDPVPATVPRRQ
jgi:hypothetical protein